jgi:exopolyphosphatase/guanosine-5'-triphosphate,3'-diphosphate pyrophosphatase
LEETTPSVDGPPTDLVYAELTSSPNVTTGSSQTPIVAAVDCGTNSTRLLVVGAEGIALDRQMRITRLGEGVDATHTLSATAVRRTLDVLGDYGRRMNELGTSRVRAIATSAVRDAHNSSEFMNAAAEILGVGLEVLSGEEEGTLSFAGATAGLPAAMSELECVVVDIGGGSTEIIVGRPARHGRSAEVRVRSLDIGCVRVSERYFAKDPPSGEELERARRAVLLEVRKVAPGLSHLGRDTPLIGLAGTVSTLACLNVALSEYDRNRIHHTVLSRSDVEHWFSVLSKMSSRARLELPGMVAGREDVIVGGALVLIVLMEEIGCETCLVSEDDILDGIAASVRD